MDGASKSNQHDHQPGEPNLMQTFPVADLVSLEALVNLLVRKGLCTPEELFEEEKRRQDYYQKLKDVSIVKTKELQSRADDSSERPRYSWLKRKMSKRRWTRRLGTALFGWRWRKVKKSPKKGELEDI
ncbi:MAG: hypothetical protein ACE5IW_08495 [bacterium]